MMRTVVNPKAKAKTTDKRKKEITPKEAARIYEDLGINLPAEFCDEAERACRRKIFLGDIDEILRMARFWSRCFLEDEEPGKQFGIFVAHRTISMFKIGCAVINSNPISSAFIGNIVKIDPNAELLKDKDVNSRLSSGMKAALPHTRTCNKYDEISIISEV